jgi:vancomycin resistance protein YoaR
LRQGTTHEWVAQGASAVGSLPVRNLGFAAGAFCALLLILLGIGVAGIQVAYSGRIYPGVRAMGVNVGGMTRDEGRVALADQVATMSNRSIVIGFKELSWTIAGHHLGVRPDVEPVLDEAFKLGREGNIFSRLAFQVQLAYDGASHAVHASGYDPVAMSAFMQALADAVDRPTTDATLALRPEGTVEYVEGQTGRTLHVEATQRRLAEALARPDVGYVELPIDEQIPRVGSAELAAAKAQAENFLSSPIALKFEELSWELTPKQLVTMASIPDTEGVRLDRGAIKTWATALAKEVEQEPQNARFSWQNGVTSLLRESKDGRSLDVEKTVDLVMAKALTTDRTITLPISVTEPEVSQDDADKLHIQGAIEVSRTSFAGSSPPKQHNIGLATQRLNGVVVPPGKLFSFNKEVGSTSLDDGYMMGWGIANAGGRNVKTVPSVAGGICQVATTLFHSVFWGGYQIEQRNYHLYWISGYNSKGVEGLDATVDEEVGLDFRFTNNTENYLLIQSWVEGGRVVFGLYGTTPDWTVKVQSGGRTDVQKASHDQIVEDEPTLPAGQRLAVEGAMDGFKVVNTRTVTRSGEEPRILRLTSVYRPSRNVVMVGTGGRPARPSQVLQNRPTSGGAQAAPATSATPAPAPKPSAPAPTAAARPSSNQATPSAPTPAPKPTTSQPTPAAKPSTAPAVPAAPAPNPVISPLFPGTAPKPGGR